jgi:hypothetical protein
MANVIKLRRSAVQGNVPTTSQIALGEVAINTYDGKLFIKKDDGTATVVEPGYNGAIVSDAAPTARPDGSSLVNGDQWWESDTGDFYIYYGTSWIEVGGGGGGGIAEAPQDGSPYFRQDGAWENADELALYRYQINADGGNFDNGEARGAYLILDAGDFNAGTSTGIDQTVDGGVFA